MLAVKHDDRSLTTIFTPTWRKKRPKQVLVWLPRMCHGTPTHNHSMYINKCKKSNVPASSVKNEIQQPKISKGWLTGLLKQLKPFTTELRGAQSKALYVNTHLSQRFESGDWLSLCRISTMPMSRNLSWRSWEPKRLKLLGYWTWCRPPLSSRFTRVTHSNPSIPCLPHGAGVLHARTFSQPPSYLASLPPEPHFHQLHPGFCW